MEDILTSISVALWLIFIAIGFLVFTKFLDIYDTEKASKEYKELQKENKELKQEIDYLKIKKKYLEENKKEIGEKMKEKKIAWEEVLTEEFAEAMKGYLKEIAKTAKEYAENINKGENKK